MNNKKAIALLGLISLLSLIYSISTFRIIFSLACYVFLYIEWHRKATRKKFISIPSTIPEIQLDPEQTNTQSTEETDCVKETDVFKEADYCIKRKNIAKNISEQALFIRRSIDQSPRRKVPVRSYKADNIPEEIIKKIEEKFSTVECEIINTEVIEPEAIEPEAIEPEVILFTLNNIENNIEESAAIEEEIPDSEVYVKIPDEMPEGFTDVGYIDTGLIVEEYTVI